MLSSILDDALLFLSTPEFAAMLLASRHFSAVADGVVARRTLRAVWIRHYAGEIHVTIASSTLSGSRSIQGVVLSATDDIEKKLRSFLLGGIIDLCGVETRALANPWFGDVLRSLLGGGIVSRTLRLHLSNDASVDFIYALVERFHYVKVGIRGTTLRL